MTGRTEKASPERTLFPIIGIGASAGGLDAFKRFVTSMPADSGMAFVLVQHLDPNHESLTADLLARHTTRQVVEARDQMPVEMNHVSMIPPNKYLTIRERVLQLSEPVLRRGLPMPIDNFFRSLAEAHEERAIGIILSGTGSDGTLGLKSIKYVIPIDREACAGKRPRYTDTCLGAELCDRRRGLQHSNAGRRTAPDCAKEMPGSNLCHGHR